MTRRTRLRRLRMGLATLFGRTPQGFFSPYRYAQTVEAPAGYPALEPLFENAMGAHDAVLAKIDEYAPRLAEFVGPPPLPRLDQGWFPTLDAAAAYALLRDAPPARIVEVGSGHSTRFLSQACQDAGAEVDHICIDPQPRASLASLPVSWREAVLATEHLPLFDALDAGDVAFFDSSHILWPGTDVDLILNTILPRLKSGVVVHVHDIFLPDGYPDGWAWRGYTEQNGLAPWVLSGGLNIIFASHFARTRLAAMERPTLQALPAMVDAAPTSLWLRKT